MTVALPKAEYFELRAAALMGDALELEAVKIAAEYGRRVQAAQARTRALMEALAKAHGFDAEKSYRWDDAATSLVGE